MKHFIISFFLFILPVFAFCTSNDALDTVVFSKFEYGLNAFVYHKSQWGKDNAEFDYVRSGAQDLLFPTSRLEVGMQLRNKHMFSFLYQPIFAESEVVLDKDVQFDSISFKKGTNLLVTYDFPFYRFSYWYHIKNSESFNLWLGGGLQIRNANIKFRDRTGSSAFRTSSLGPVPLFHILMDNQFGNTFSIRSTASGFWAPIKYLNGGQTDVNGWIYEFEIQPRMALKNDWEIFSSFRLLGGGAIGNSKNIRTSGGTYSRDILVTTSFTVGVLKKI